MKWANITEFLEEEVDHRMNDFDPFVKIPRWKRIGYLLYCNGGSFEVHGWGVTGYHGGIFKSGLTQNEAIELVSVSGILGGASMYDNTFDTIYFPKIKDWLKELTAEYEKQNKITTDG